MNWQWQDVRQLKESRHCPALKWLDTGRYSDIGPRDIPSWGRSYPVAIDHSEHTFLALFAPVLEQDNFP